MEFGDVCDVGGEGVAVREHLTVGGHGLSPGRPVLGKSLGGSGGSEKNSL